MVYWIRVLQGSMPGIRAEKTAKSYTQYLNYFLGFVKIKEAGGLLQLKDTVINEIVEDWVLYLKSKGLRKSTIRGQLLSCLWL